MAWLPFPGHPHLLVLRELSDRCVAVECVACQDEIRGSMYCCEECRFYLHKSCALELPSEIQHPFHPEHPLRMRHGKSWVRCGACAAPGRLGYCCNKCEFNLHVGCAVSTLPGEDDTATFQNLPHHAHPLTRLRVKMKSLIQCAACPDKISGEAYGCHECRFFLHRTCAETPRDVQHHPLHPRHSLSLAFDSSGEFNCNACGCSLRLAYRCEECEFNLGVLCMNSTLPLEGQREDDRSTMSHFSHEHPLTYFIARLETHIRCNICDESISGEFYGCLECRFFLHESCTHSPLNIQHLLHPQHSLTLTPYRGDEYATCLSCSGGLGRCFTYGCRTCDFHLHKDCALRILAYLEEGASPTLSHFRHEHELKLCHMDKAKRCSACLRADKGPAYQCECGLLFHKSCAAQESEVQHPSHPEHPLALCIDTGYENPPCNACHRVCRAVTFACEKCEFRLHPDCASREPVKHPFHEHDLTYYEEAKDMLCNACNKSCRVDLYRCPRCDFSVHHDCFQLPHQVKSNHHIDVLILKQSHVEDDWGEHYCDICEWKRDPKQWVYFCEVCELVAHVACALSPVKLEPIKVNPAVTKLDEEIKRVEEELDTMRANMEALKKKLEALETEREEADLEMFIPAW